MDTDIERFYKIVNKLGKISFKEAAREMSVSDYIIEEWARALETSGLVKLTYPLSPLESPKVISKQAPSPVAVEEKKEVKVPKKEKRTVKKPVKKTTVKKKPKPVKKRKLARHAWRA